MLFSMPIRVSAKLFWSVGSELLFMSLRAVKKKAFTLDISFTSELQLQLAIRQACTLANRLVRQPPGSVSYTHLRAHETGAYL
eukprot:1435113-Pyramimonas_sp.AAC.1